MSKKGKIIDIMIRNIDERPIGTTDLQIGSIITKDEKFIYQSIMIYRKQLFFDPSTYIIYYAIKETEL